MSVTLIREITSTVEKVPNCRIEWHKPHHGARLDDHVGAGICTIILRAKDEMHRGRGGWYNSTHHIHKNELTEYQFLSAINGFLYMLWHSYRAGQRERSQAFSAILADH